MLWPEEILNQKSAPVLDTEFNTDALKDFAKTLVETMVAARGVGISAPQVGALKRIIVIPNPVQFAEPMSAPDGAEPKVLRTDEPPFLVLCNPEVTPVADALTTKEQEGCLSLPGVLLQRERVTKVNLKGRTTDGLNYDQLVVGLAAIAAQHETDHLDGKTIADNIGPMQKHMIMKKLNKLTRAMEKAERKQEQARIESIRAKARQADEYAFNRKNPK